MYLRKRVQVDLELKVDLKVMLRGDSFCPSQAPCVFCHPCFSLCFLTLKQLPLLATGPPALIPHDDFSANHYLINICVSPIKLEKKKEI